MNKYIDRLIDVSKTRIYRDAMSLDYDLFNSCMCRSSVDLFKMKQLHTVTCLSELLRKLK